MRCGPRWTATDSDRQLTHDPRPVRLRHRLRRHPGAAELGAPPTVIICGNDVVALGSLNAARELGVACPNEVSVVGFDDLPAAGWAAGPAHHRAFDLDAMARTAGQSAGRADRGRPGRPVAARDLPDPVDLAPEPGGSVADGRTCLQPSDAYAYTGHRHAEAMPLDPIAYKPYADPDDFIREVTDLIWVNRAIGHIRENYEPDSIVHGSYGTSSAATRSIEGSLMRIADTPGPDRPGRGRGLGGARRRRVPELAPGPLRRPEQRLHQPDDRQLPLPPRPDGRGVGGARLRSPSAVSWASTPTSSPGSKAFQGYSGSMTQPAAGRRDRRRGQRTAAR